MVHVSVCFYAIRRPFLIAGKQYRDETGCGCGLERYGVGVDLIPSDVTSYENGRPYTKANSVPRLTASLLHYKPTRDDPSP